MLLDAFNMPTSSTGFEADACRDARGQAKAQGLPTTIVTLYSDLCNSWNRVDVFRYRPTEGRAPRPPTPAACGSATVSSPL